MYDSLNLSKLTLFFPYISLFSDCSWYIDIVDHLMNLALHHCTSVVVLNISFPSMFWHGWLFLEALFPEIFNCIIVSICQKVLQSFLLSICFQPIHKSCTISFNLFWCCYSKEHNFCKFLFLKGAEDTTTKDLRTFFCLAPNDNHGLMLSIHYQPNNVVSWHPW